MDDATWEAEDARDRRAALQFAQASLQALIYIGVPDIDAALKNIVASGGGVSVPRMVVPNVVTFALFTDPAGNRMGLVERKDG